jgi:hypothetical protein
MNVQKFIDEWKIGIKLGRWTSKKLECSVYENEELFLISVELRINNSIIKKNRHFQTCFNEFPKIYQISPNTEENILSLILVDLENQLMEEYSKLLEQGIINLLQNKED